MEEKIKSIMANVFQMKVEKFPKVIRQSNIKNWDSLRHLNLIIELEEAFDATFEPEDIAEMTSMDKIIEIINKQ